MAAPSGKFCTPTPRARATAAVNRAGSSAWAARAKETPTAMPSGILCRVTASTSIRVRRREVWPSRQWKDSGAKWGSRASMASKNAMPRADPPAAGSQPARCSSRAFSMEGMSRDHTLAASITPAAKPSITRCSPGELWRRNRKTTQAPRAVIPKVNPVPRAAKTSACVTMYVLSSQNGGGSRKDRPTADASKAGYAGGEEGVSGVCACGGAGDVLQYEADCERGAGIWPGMSICCYAATERCTPA